MALPEGNELNRVDEQTRLKQLDEQNGLDQNQSRIDERHMAEDREFRDPRRLEEEHRAHGHDFTMDFHPERYPRESLSRLEEGILDDDRLRHEDERLGFNGPDLEARIMNGRSLSRLLVVLGACLIGFSWVLLLWVGWDLRSGKAFFISMCVTAFVIGLALAAWGYVERFRVMRLLRRMPTIARGEKSQGIGRERKLAEGDRAA
ncbi:MAG: hypothetical protein JOZ10_05550 [Acidobacteria bacterium]|nr:hypothetical protein [Acidobacteriota bacterium]MBV9436809.1 hypothetical protein [Acidobacteriota bacterium]